MSKAYKASHRVEIAKKLRYKGLSYREIKKETGISKSTLSYWLKDIKLAQKYRKKLYTKQIEMLNRGAYSQKARRQREVELIIHTAKSTVVDKLSDDILRFMGVALYWAEGTKDASFIFTNSDPCMVLFMVQWIEKIFKIPPANLKAGLNIHKNQDDDIVKYFWSDLLGIPKASFGKSYIKPDGKKYKQNNLYLGTIKIYIPKSTDLKWELFGWLEAILPDIRKSVEFTRQKYFAPITQSVE